MQNKQLSLLADLLNTAGYEIISLDDRSWDIHNCCPSEVDLKIQWIGKPKKPDKDDKKS